MFRESLPLAKEKFGRYVEDKANFARIPHAKRQLEVLTHLIQKTFDAYGQVGIYHDAPPRSPPPRTPF